jgi:ketosteroid isomerase-like protein
MRTIAVVLSVCALAVPVWADTPAMSSTSWASSTDASAVAAIRQLGQDMGDAMVHLDVDTIDKMFGDDWVSVGKSGTVFTKQSLMNDIKTGKKRLTWFQLQPIDVQVFGETAIAQGKVSEKRVIDGKESYMELVYADILRKRDGRWVVVQSMGAKIE